MKTVLYVDDEEAIGRAVARWFGRRGDVVHVARTLAEARAILAQHEPDVVFIDVWLGAESGFELLAWLEDERPELTKRVTFVTGELADAGSATRVWRTLGRPVLQKPFDFAKLESYATDADAEKRAVT